MMAHSVSRHPLGLRRPMAEVMIAPPAGVILSGGRSQRMGAPKALAAFGGQRLVDHVAARLAPQVAAVMLNSNQPDITLAGTSTFADRFAGHLGPLAGIHASLLESRDRLPEASHVAVVPVDTPFFPRDLVARLQAALESPDEAALAMSRDRLHPVVGLWPVSAAPALEAWLLDPPTLKVQAFLERLTVRSVTFASTETRFGPVDPFFNINTPENLALARDIHASGDLNRGDPQP